MDILQNCLRDLRRQVHYYLRFIWLTVIPMHIRQILTAGKTHRMSRIVSRSQKKSIRKHEDIPMSKGWPLIGTIFDFIAAGSSPNLHKYIDKRHQQFGHIFRERIGTQEAVFVSSANLMRSVFMYEGQYPIHPLPESWVLYNKLHSCRRGLFFMDGKEWHTNRKIMNRILLNGNLDWINTHINFCTDKLIEYWKAEEEKVDSYLMIDNLEGQLYRWSIEVVCAVMFGYDIENGSIKIALDEFSKSVHKIFKDSVHLMNFPPKLAQLLHMKVWTQFEKNVTNVLQMGNDIFEMSLKQSEAGESDGLFSKMQFAGMSMDVIKRIFIDLIIAAGDTTAFSSQWALYLLSQNDDIQEKIRADYLKSEMKDQTLRGLLKETFRLFPVAPFIGRSLASDAIIGDYEIKKNTLVLLSLYTSGRDPNHFPEPLRMKPERWLRNVTTGELNDVLQAHGSLPFAIGNRSCIGRKIALSQMSSLLLAVTKNFKIKCLNEVPVDIVLRLVSVPNHPLQLGIKSLGW